MKEIEDFLLKIEKRKSRYQVELGYRNPYGEWSYKYLKCDYRPHINEYANEFTPKLSTCRSIKFMELDHETNKYHYIECWFKTKKGWKKQ